MIKLERHPNNPILLPDKSNSWEHDGAFNGCVVEVNGTFHMVYRALSSEKRQNGINMRVSTVGYATSPDGVTFSDHRMLFGPTEDWEVFGCEDPRITYHEGKFYIFYTALSVFPFAAYGIKTAIAITKDFKTFEKHPVSTFNAKAMALFPEKINGKMAALITINTDLPPAKIAYVEFEREDDIWSPYFWQEWYDNVNEHSIHLLRDLRDQIELGSPPIKTDEGWLVMYSYIRNYLSNEKDFGIEAVLLDLSDPQKVISRTEYSLLNPEAKYELEGDVPDIVFPSGALIHDTQLYVYYGAADTRVCLATCPVEEILDDLLQRKHVPHASTYMEHTKDNKLKVVKFTRFAENPIIVPSLELDWQTMGTFNPAAIYADGKVHIVYRAQAMNGTSVMGYASSRDGLHIDENLSEPIYYPRETFEQKLKGEGFSGCEDPRLTEIDGRYYMTYTAYDGINPPRVAMTSILVEDFLKRQWNWASPQLISIPTADDKDACIIKGKKPHNYLGFHRLGHAIWIDVRDELDFSDTKFMSGKEAAHPREGMWDNVKIGIASPPLETEKGWLLLYHGVGNLSGESRGIYKVGAMLLDYKDPFHVIARSNNPIFEPETEYEKVGVIPNVVFPCGIVTIKGIIYMYYGGADKVVGVASFPMQVLLDDLLQQA